jgi:hypothetical protein
MHTVKIMLSHLRKEGFFDVIVHHAVHHGANFWMDTIMLSSATLLLGCQAGIRNSRFASWHATPAAHVDTIGAVQQYCVLLLC